jgi:phosphate transport system substrate-binding protein
MKKIVSVLLLSVISLTGFVGCSQDTSKTAKVVSELTSSTAPVSEGSNSSATESKTVSAAQSESSSSDQSSASSVAPAANSNSQTASSKANTASVNNNTSTVAAITPQGKDYTPAAKSLSGTVSFSGSTSVYPAIAALSEAFKKIYPNVKISITNVTGSGAGLSDANAKRVSFGMRSSAWDTTTATNNPNIVPYSIALDGVAIVVHTDNTIANITKSQLADLYKVGATVTQWNQLTGSSLTSDVLAVCREAGSGTRDCFETVVPGLKGTAYDSQANRQIAASTDAVKTAVKGNKQAIGYMSLGSVDSSVKALTYEGVIANKANVQNGSYTFQRPFLLLRNKTKTMSDADKEFLKFVYSKEGQTIIDKGGFVDLAQGSIDAELDKAGLR